MKEQHKLAAIMFTDITGYSALMSKDEKHAMDVLAKNRNIHKAAIARFNGEYIKEVGDGTLAIFPSSIDAVNCAIVIQRAYCKETSLQVRIGIHTGDIIVKDGDVFGDGVNIGSRIEAAGEPGGIYISEKVYDDIKNKVGIKVEFYGEKILKNIPDPVRIYSITKETISHRKARIPVRDQGKDIPLRPTYNKGPVRPFTKITVLTAGVILILIAGFFIVRPYLLRAAPDSGSVPIAVISFKNQTGDTSFNYLQQAIPNLLITNLEQSRLFQVMTWERMHDVMNQLGRKNVEIIDADLGFGICRKEGCRFIVIGSFVKAGEVFATDAKVLDVETKKIINSVNSRGSNVGSILEIQIDELSKSISRSVGISARKVETARMRVRDVTTSSLEAYNYFLKGRDALDRWYAEEALQQLEKAVKIDPGFATAYLYLSSTYERLYNFQKANETIEKAYLASTRATENEQLMIHATYAGVIKQDFQQQLRLLLELSEKAPREKRVFYELGLWYKYNDQPDKAIDALKKTIELDPSFGQGYNQLGYMFFDRGEYTIAMEYLSKYASLNPGDANPFDSMGDMYWRMGDLDKALICYQRALEVKPDFYFSTIRTSYIYVIKEDYLNANLWMEKALETAPSEERRGVDYTDMAYLDYFYGRFDKAMHSLEHASAIATENNNSLILYDCDRLRSYIYFDLGQYQNAHQINLRQRDDATFTGAEAEAGYYFRTSLIHINLNQLDSAAFYAEKFVEKMRSLSSDDYWKYNYNYLTREIQIAAARDPDDLDSITPEIIRPASIISGDRDLPYMDNSLAEAFHRFGKRDKAIAEYERLMIFDPDRADLRLTNPRYHYYLGILYQEKGMKDKAIEQYRKFLDLWRDADPIFKEPDDARKRLGQLLD